MGILDLFRKRGPKHAAKNPPPQLCFVLSPRTSHENFTRAQEAVDRVFGPGCTTEVSEGALIVTRGEALIGMIAHVTAPIPEGEADHAADGNPFWENGLQQAKAHKSHAIITNMGSGQQLSHVDSAIGLARLALVALDLLDGIGVYWGYGSISNNRETFEGFCEEMSDQKVPLPAMMRFQIIEAEGGRGLGIYTLGMSQFGLMEIEIDECGLDPEALFEFTADLAHYLVTNGPVIQDGNTVGGSEQEKILVRHKPSMVERGRLVYKVCYE